MTEKVIGYKNRDALYSEQYSKIVQRDRVCLSIALHGTA